MRLLNKYEELTYDLLTKTCETNGARVFPKVRLADIFQLANSGISNNHYHFGLCSHFDFVVTDKEYRPLFSVEFDGPLHKDSTRQQQRDALKNDLCEHFNHALLRINSKYLTPAYRGLDLLTYFVDAWFLERAFEEAQHNGIIPYDEPFDVNQIYSRSDQQSRKWPYWLTYDIQLAIRRFHSEGRIDQMVPSHYVGVDSEHNYWCMSWLAVDADNVLSATTGMRAQKFPLYTKAELVSMLAMFDLYEKLQIVLAGDRRLLVGTERFFGERLPSFQDGLSMLSSIRMDTMQ